LSAGLRAGSFAQEPPTRPMVCRQLSDEYLRVAVCGLRPSRLVETLPRCRVEGCHAGQVPLLIIFCRSRAWPAREEKKKMPGRQVSNPWPADQYLITCPGAVKPEPEFTSARRGLVGAVCLKIPSFVLHPEQMVWMAHQPAVGGEAGHEFLHAGLVARWGTRYRSPLPRVTSRARSLPELNRLAYSPGSGGVGYIECSGGPPIVPQRWWRLQSGGVELSNAACLLPGLKESGLCPPHAEPSRCRRCPPAPVT